MDKDIINEMDIEDEYEMVPISPERMNFHMKPEMNNYPMENNIDYDGMYNIPNINPTAPMNPSDMIDPMNMGNMNTNPIAMPMMPCMMHCMYYMNCMNMQPKYMDPMQPQMSLGMMMSPMMPEMMEGAIMPNMMPEMMNTEDYEMSSVTEKRTEEDTEDIINNVRANEEELRYNPRDVDEILRKIQRYNPGVFRMLRSYGVPYDEARRICRRIIRLTLTYYEK